MYDPYKIVNRVYTLNSSLDFYLLFENLAFLQVGYTTFKKRERSLFSSSLLIQFLEFHINVIALLSSVHKPVLTLLLIKIFIHMHLCMAIWQYTIFSIRWMIIHNFDE